MNTSKFAYWRNEEYVEFVTDKIAIAPSFGRKCVEHFCDGYETVNGAVWCTRVGAIKKNWRCSKCKHRLTPRERFAIKVLMFNDRDISISILM
jgi:hypothetical protein